MGSRFLEERISHNKGLNTLVRVLLQQKGHSVLSGIKTTEDPVLSLLGRVGFGLIGYGDSSQILGSRVETR